MKAILFGLAGTLMAWQMQPAAAASFPDHPVRMIVPYAAGGNTDIGARVLAEGLADELGQSVVVENKSGANTAVGSSYVAQSKPDGYTVLFTTISFVVNPYLYENLGYDSKKDFAPVAWVSINPLILVTSPTVPAKNLTDFIAYLKHNDKVPYGSSGAGGAMHLAAELFRYRTGVDVMHVPYRGENPVLVDMLGGRVKFAFSSASASAEYIKAGKLNALAIAGPKRSPLLPQVPTASEAGLKDFNAYTWCVVLAPAGTPKDVVERLNAAVNRAVARPQVKDKLVGLGFDPIADSTPATTAAHIDQESAKWGALIKDSGMKVE